MLGVGSGKTLVSVLCPELFDDVTVAVLLVPAALVSKTRSELREYARNFKITKTLHIVSYEALSVQAQAELLFDLKPQLIVADEAHALRNQDSGRCRRVQRYVEASGCRFVCLSGTLYRDSLTDILHLCRWALRHNCAHCLPSSAGNGIASQFAAAVARR